jgi:hypothetical protein
MRRTTTFLQLARLAILTLTIAVSAQGQTANNAGGYSDSIDAQRSRSVKNEPETSPAQLLRDARTIYIQPNDYIDAEYLEYKLDKLPDFQQWRLAFVRDSDKADLVLEIHRKALNYIFSVVDRESSVVIVKGKVVAINGLVAAEDISKQIVKRMQAVRALPVNE